MILSREQIRSLAGFLDSNASALSFYYQPASPSNRAHKEDAILIKELIREAQHKLPDANKSSAREDLDRLGRVMSDFRSNGTHAKAVFACAGQRQWYEFDLPPQLSGTQLFVDRHFHLKPLARMLGALPSLGIALVDRHRARFFDLRLGELTEHTSLFQPLSRKGRSDGFAGYDGGHAQRRVEDEARHHFKAVAASLKESLDSGVFQKWTLGCQDACLAQLDRQLPHEIQEARIGHFSADVAHISPDQVRSHAEQRLAEWQDRRSRELLAHAIGEARSHGHGVTGLRRVLRSIQLGEVQTLLIGEDFLAHAVECSGCGHLDAHLVVECPVCGKATHEVRDVGEAILPWVIRRDIEMFYVKSDPEFDRLGNIAAILRFRAEKGAEAHSVARTVHPAVAPGSGLRLRRAALR